MNTLAPGWFQEFFEKKTA